MKSESINMLTSTELSYSTILRIIDDPEVQQFSTRALAFDKRLNARVIISVNEFSKGIIASSQVGDEIVVSGALSRLDNFNSYRKWEHIVGEYHVEEIYSISSHPLIYERLAQIFRQHVIDGCSLLSQNNSGVCEALLIGEKNHISFQTYSNYKQAQLTHLLVASGANIAFLVGFVSPLIAKRSRTTRAVMLIVIALFYCVATRFEPSILRACFMVVIPQLFIICGIKRKSHDLFLIAIFTCLLLDPFLSHRVGFWLSVAAAFGLQFVSQYIIKVLRLTIIAQTLASTICVQPILWVVFGFRLPTLWWISVIGVAIAEPLTTLGMVVIFSISILPNQWGICTLCTIPIDVVINILNSLAKFGANRFAHVVGLLCNFIIIFVYTRRNIKPYLKDRCFRGTTQRFLYYR